MNLASSINLFESNSAEPKQTGANPKCKQNKAMNTNTQTDIVGTDLIWQVLCLFFRIQS